ncbi:MAG: A/G-specific adenine glycosylase [Candidatus Cyclobacteriaceae bacterium M2_1C_046]
MKFREFDKKLINWYKSIYRPLPWRNIREPYKIWLSEIILQQTRVAQGLPYFEKFIDRFPTLQDLAEAEDDEVLRIWQGLGYYSRARNLIKCARMVAYELQGKFPENFDDLLKLPGVGPYTAAAIASFSFKEKVAVVDGNVYRVLSRIFGIKEDISKPSSAKFFKIFSEKLMPIDEPDLYNQAIMEFGATVCLPKKPKCESCIFSEYCYAFEHRNQSSLPVKSKKTKVRSRKFFYVVIHNEEGCLMKKRTAGDIWTELYDFLWIDAEQVNDISFITEDPLIKPLVNEPIEIYHSSPVKHILSHQKLEVSFIHLTKEQLPEDFGYQDQNLKFFSWEEIMELPKPVLIHNYLLKMNFI